MNRNHSACNDEQLLVLLRADEDSEEACPVVSHVQHCKGCQQRLEELAASADDWDEASELLAAHRLATADIGEQHANRWSARDFAARPVAWNEAMSKSLLSSPSHPEMLGRIGRYDVERLIGSGGMGVVFKAHDTELNRPVAVKLLAPYLAASGAARSRFAREARAAAAVVDDHVVPIHNVETDDEHPFLVMKYIAGGSLQQRLDREGPLEVCEVLRIGMQTAKGLASAHAQGLIHRDVKPSNILLDEGVDRALLTDFGLARATDDASLTRSGFHPGTPHYMSPEQVRGGAIDDRSDLFGLGCVLYALCTGHPPFRSETSYAVLRRITDDTPRPIRETNPDVPAWLEQMVMKLLAKSPDDRFGSAEQVAELLEDCLAHVQQPAASPLPAGVSVLAAQSRPPSIWTLPTRLKATLQHNSRPPIGKFIAAAAFAFLLIFAGVLIVLERNKGTLTIESEVDDIPIRIMQGDQVVKKMTVTRGNESTRIATGSYVVEIDGRFDGIEVKDKALSLKRGDDVTVRIIRANDIDALSQVDHFSAPAVIAPIVSDTLSGKDLEKVIQASREANTLAENTASDNSDRSQGSAPKLGEPVLLRLAGNVAGKYAESVRPLANGQAVDGLKIEVLATVVQRLSDGRLRVEHQSTPRVVFTEYDITLLMATVDPSAIKRVTTPQGAITKSSPGAAIESLTAEETHSYRLTLSDLDDVVLKSFRVPLPLKAAALSELQFKRTSPALTRLLELNGDGTTYIEKLGHPTNFAGIKDVEEIHSNGKNYVAVAARRFPPEVEQPFGKSGYGVIFLFDKTGNVAAKFGGNLGPDRVNGEDVQLLTLGTENQWFAVVHLSQPNGTFKKSQKVFLIENGFPLAFEVHAVESMAWTSAPDRVHDYGFEHFFNPGGMPSREFGKGHDGKDYYPALAWDENKRVFRGPSQLTYKDKLLFTIRLGVSKRFQAVDRPDAKKISDDESRFDTPEVLMKYAADCQTRDDVAGLMSCWTDEPVKQFATSYLMTAVAMLQEFESNPAASRPSHYAERMEELKRILSEEIGDEAATIAAALSMVNKEVVENAGSDFEEVVKASACSPLVQLLSSATADRLKAPRRFVARFHAWAEEGAEADPESEENVFAYTVEQDGDTATATDRTEGRTIRLIKTEMGWLINDPTGCGTVPVATSTSTSTVNTIQEGVVEQKVSVTNNEESTRTRSGKYRVHIPSAGKPTIKAVDIDSAGSASAADVDLSD